VAALRFVRVRFALAASFLVAAFALSALADGLSQPRRAIDVSRALDAAAPPASPPDVAVTRTPPDPLPLVERGQWVFDLRWERGDVWLLGAHRLELPAPRATPRAMGRFALELFEGRALVERVRFDFPLLGAPDPGDGGRGAPPSLTQRLRTRVGVFFPATDRGRRLELVDRATDKRWSLAWPPEDASDASVPRDGGSGP
jgi:hypothetical protein